MSKTLIIVISVLILGGLAVVALLAQKTHLKEAGSLIELYSNQGPLSRWKKEAFSMLTKGEQIEEYFRSEVHRLYALIQENLDSLNYEKFYMTRGYLNAIRLALGKGDQSPKLKVLKGGRYLEAHSKKLSTAVKGY